MDILFRFAILVMWTVVFMFVGFALGCAYKPKEEKHGNKEISKRNL